MVYVEVTSNVSVQAWKECLDDLSEVLGNPAGVDVVDVDCLVIDCDSYFDGVAVWGDVSGVEIEVFPAVGY